MADEYGIPPNIFGPIDALPTYPLNCEEPVS